MNKNLKSLAFSVTLLLGTALAQAQHPLKVGDPAPAMKVATWLKGTPVTGFQKGTVYLVDFWATWCEACNESFPHMSEVAKEFNGKVVVIGVDVSEQPKADQDLRSMLNDFVNKKGDNMAYNICMDDPKSHYMNSAWMIASAEPGIPCVFVIDQSGTIADVIVGYGKSDHRVDETVSKLLAGTFDREEAVSRFNKSLKDRELSFEMNEALRPIYTALKAKDYRLSLQLVDGVLAKNPDIGDRSPKSAGILTSIRYNALIHLDQDKAYDMAVKAKDSKDAPNIARVIVSQEALPKRFYEYAIDVFQVEETAKTDGWQRDSQSLATAYSLDGNPAKAAESEQKFLDVMTEMEKGLDPDPTTQKFLDEVRAKIKEYQDAAKKLDS